MTWASNKRDINQGCRLQYVKGFQTFSRILGERERPTIIFSSFIWCNLSRVEVGIAQQHICLVFVCLCLLHYAFILLNIMLTENHPVYSGICGNISPSPQTRTLWDNHHNQKSPNLGKPIVQAQTNRKASISCLKCCNIDT